MNKELIKLYAQLDEMVQTKEIKQIKQQVKETLYQKLKENLLEFVSIGRVIGYDEIQQELKKAVEFIDLYKNQ